MLTLDANVWVAAFDPKDRFHGPSVAFLRAVALQRVRLHAPAFLVLEVACAVARRAGDAGAGRAAAERLRRHPLLTLHPLERRLLSRARSLGIERLLRGADALYAATATLSRSPLVSWDEELVARAGAVTPEEWQAAGH